MQKTTFIYALCEPGTRTVRYIGKTGNLKRRFRDHIKESIKFDTRLGHWLSLLGSRGQRPEMITLREVAGDGAEAEMRYIRLARGCRIRLVNSTDGGDGCENPSTETRAKMGAAKRGKPSPLRGISRTPETRKNISEALTGRVCSEDHRRANSESRRGEKNHRFGKPSPYKGVPRTPETCAAISKSLTGKVQSEAHRTANSASHIGLQVGEKNPFFGKTWTPEHREAIRVTKALRKAEKIAQDQEIEWALAPYTLE